MELISNEVIITTTPYLRNPINDIGCPLAAAFSETITFAAAPIIVMFPPKQAPKDKHHQRGIVYTD